MDQDSKNSTVEPMDLEKARERYIAFLRTQGMLKTHERDAILEEVMSRHDHFSVEELHDSLKARGKKVSRATLYRNLDNLKDAGILDEVYLGRRHVQYEHVLGHDLHLHIIDENGKVHEETSPELEVLLNQLVAKRGLSLDSWKVQIHARKL